MCSGWFLLLQDEQSFSSPPAADAAAVDQRKQPTELLADDTDVSRQSEFSFDSPPDGAVSIAGERTGLRRERLFGCLSIDRSIDFIRRRRRTDAASPSAHGFDAQLR